MKKLSNINESVWTDIHRRSNGAQIRKEDGKKVSTCLGVDIIIKDSSCDYNHWIKEILTADPNISYGVWIDLEKYANLTPDEMINVRKFEAPYNYLIYDGAHGTSLIAGFYSYSEIEEYEYEIGECVSEEDYISICKGIATKLKEVGEYFSHVPTSRNSYIINSNQNKLSTSYDGNYELKLIDETDTYNFFIENENLDINDFIYDICHEFKELEDEDFIGWSFYDGINIAIPLNYNNLVNFQKYEKFTKEWFAVGTTNESVWADIHKRSNGTQIRKEDIKPQDYTHWWKNIPIDDVPKYKTSELRLYDFLYELIIWKVEKAMNIEKPNVIRIYFKYEDAWYLSIFHNTSHGADNYTLEANGVKHYNPIKYSEMSIGEKRSIRYRLEKKKFYVYKYSNEYALREEPEFNGEKGVLLK